MTEREAYTRSSLELHLFFLRIMKEHALFLSTGFTPVNGDFSQGALRFKQQFETLLSRTIHLGNGVVSSDLLQSCELVTGCTLTAEQQTEKLSGIPINQKLTRLEETMTSSCSPSISVELSQNVKHLNQQVQLLLDGFIRFQENISSHVQSCRMFTSNYPAMTEHLLHESLHYRNSLLALEEKNCCECAHETVDESFWNHIMMEHALFLRGLLDPAENKQIVQSNTFAEIYAELLDYAAEQESDCNCTDSKKCTRNAQKETEEFQDFKQALTVGLTHCEIRSIILPLLSDHMLREANHYLRILRTRKASETEKKD